MRSLCLSANPDASDIRYFQKTYSMQTSCDFRDIDESFDLVIVHGFDRVIPKKYFDLPKIGIFIIHSSDLPKGRGWAPIYNSIKNADKEYVLSLIKIDENVDAGNILLKMKIAKPKFISNENLRQIDEEASIKLVERFLELLKEENVCLDGLKQDEELSTYNKKRDKSDNKLNIADSIENSILDILATSGEYQSFIEIEGEIIKIKAIPDKVYKLNDLSYSFESYM